MNCASCNTPLTPGNNICPNCGALNMAFNAPQATPNVSEQSVIPGEQVVVPTVQEQVVVPTMQEQVVVPTVQEQVVNSGPVIEEGPAVEMPAFAPQVQESHDVEVLDDALINPYQQQVEVQAPVMENIPTLGDNDGILEQNESAMVVTEDSYVPEVQQEVVEMMPQVFDGNTSDEELQVSATMAPPTLNITDDVSLTAGVGSISNDNVSTYSPEEIASQQMEEKNQRRKEQDNVNFAIPSSEQPEVQVSQEVMDGGIPDMDVNLPTAGDGDGIIEGNESTEIVEEKPEDKEKAKGKKGLKGLGLGSLNLKELKSSKSLPLPFVLIGIGIFFIVGIVIGSTIFGTQTYKAGSYNRSKINADELPRVADGKNNTTKAGAFTFKIPKDYYYDLVEGGISIFDNKDTFRIYIRSDVGIYEDLATAKTSVVKTLEQQKVTVNNYKETTIGKKNYVIIQGTTNLVNRMIAFTDGGHDYIFYIEIVTKDNQYNQDLVNIAADIINNVKFDEKQSEMELIDVYDISDVVIKASTEYKKLNEQNTN